MTAQEEIVQYDVEAIDYDQIVIREFLAEHGYERHFKVGAEYVYKDVDHRLAQ